MRYIIIILFFPLLLGARELHVDTSADNLVKFVSDAPIEKFDGVTQKVDGYVIWEGENLTNNSEIYIEVDLNSLDTGIGLRNRHMRENYLETDQFPFAKFSGKLVEATSTPQNHIQAKAEGTLSIHGVERPLVVEATINPGESSYRVSTQFVVALSDFDVKIPQIMFYKINENMDLELDVTFKVIK